MEKLHEDVVFTDGQQEAYARLNTFLKDRDSEFFTLKGVAGTGKTFMMSMLEGAVDKTVFTAPTHKAVHQLRKRVQYSDCMTIHKFLGLSVGKREGKTFLRRNPNSDSTVFSNVKLVVVDEASMISEQLVKYISQDVMQWGRKYIFVGDPCQLPPVNAKGGKTPSFDLPKPEYIYTLTEIVRQAQDNPIIQAAVAIRDAIETGGETDVKTGVHGDLGVQCLRPRQFKEKLQQVITSEKAKEDQDFCRVIAWRNRTTRDYNRMCRGFLGHNPEISFDVGDLVMVNEAYVQGERDVIFNTGVELKVKNMVDVPHETYPDLECWAVEFTNVDGSEIGSEESIFVVVQDKCHDMYNQILKDLSKECGISEDWTPYYYFKENLLDIRPVYSITAHKSQGSTFDTVFLDFQDIFKNHKSSEADKCLYTAITRASRKVYVQY